MSIADIAQANQALMPIVGPIISAASGLGGVLIGASLTARTERRRLKLAFAEKRLTEFYSPMLGLRKGIRAVSELRVKIEQASDSGWREVAGSMGDDQFEPGATEKRFAPYSQSIEYDNKQFKEELLPEYEKMVSLFREKMHLAYPDTAEDAAPQRSMVGRSPITTRRYSANTTSGVSFNRRARCTKRRSNVSIRSEAALIAQCSASAKSNPRRWRSTASLTASQCSTVTCGIPSRCEIESQKDAGSVS